VPERAVRVRLDRPLGSVIHWPGMRSEYAWLPPRHGASTTEPQQVGVSFSRHRSAVYEAAGRAERSDIAAGAVFVSGDDGIRWGAMAEPIEALEIYPDPELMARVAPGAGIVPALGVRDTVVFGVASVLKRVHVAGGALTDVEASTLAHRLVAHVAGAYRDGGPVPDRPPVGGLDRRAVERVAEHVDARLGETITLDRLAAVAAFSPFHFARAFKATTGMAPHRFVTARRLEAAKTGLLTTDASVVAIAHAVGFSNVSHFRRVFRRELGLAPGELRADRKIRPA
jgi:AraC family transcriptional regulator